LTADESEAAEEVVAEAAEVADETAGAEAGEGVRDDA